MLTLSFSSDLYFDESFECIQRGKFNANFKKKSNVCLNDVTWGIVVNMSIMGLFEHIDLHQLEISFRRINRKQYAFCFAQLSNK